MKRLSVFLASLLFASAAAAELRGPTNQILIPAAGAVAGANGTFFRSDVTLTNLRDTDQQVEMFWLPQRSVAPPPGLPPPQPVTITIPARSGIASEDFVTNYMHVTGLGAILITALSPAGAIDPDGLLFATARIWTQQPGSSGSVSQTFPVVPTGAINAGSQVLILGLHDDDRYRANVGVVNLDSSGARTFDVYQNTDNPNLQPLQSTITVGPESMQQIALIPRVSAVLQVTIVPRAGTDPHSWVAYGSSIDNVTGDSWSNLAMPLLNP